MVTPRPPTGPVRTPAAARASLGKMAGGLAQGLSRAPGLKRAPAVARPGVSAAQPLARATPPMGGGKGGGSSATPRFAGPPGAPKQRFGKSASNVPKSGKQPTIPTKKPATRSTPTAVKGKPSPGMKGFGGTK